MYSYRTAYYYTTIQRYVTLKILLRTRDFSNDYSYRIHKRYYRCIVLQKTRCTCVLTEFWRRVNSGASPRGHFDHRFHSVRSLVVSRCVFSKTFCVSALLSNTKRRNVSKSSHEYPMTSSVFVRSLESRTTRSKLPVACQQRLPANLSNRSVFSVYRFGVFQLKEVLHEVDKF